MNFIGSIDAQALHVIGIVFLIAVFSIIIATAILFFILCLKAKKQGKTRYDGAIIVGSFPHSVLDRTL